MAEVDLSSAVLQPYNANPLGKSYISLYESFSITNSSGTSITSSLTTRNLQDTSDSLIMSYTGTFNASGTEFYLKSSSIHWKVSNVSFASGDTFNFQINTNLVVN